MRVKLLAADYIQPGALVGSEHDVSSEEAARLIERGLAKPAKGNAPDEPKDETPNERWNKTQLREYAERHGINLGEADTKAELLDAIANAKPAKGDDE